MGENNKNNPVKYRKVFYVEVKLSSPLSVSSGEDEWTDSDVLRDYEGHPFVSGSSLAGAMRAYLGYDKDGRKPLEKCQEEGASEIIAKDENDKCLMGYSRNNDGRMSSLFISDMQLKEPKITTRDNVALNENKIAIDGAKFDMEVVEARATGSFFMELTIREGDDEKSFEEELARIFYGISKGEIRLGKKKTRGFGVLELTSIHTKTYDRNNYSEYKDAFNKDGISETSDEREDWIKKGEDWIKEKENSDKASMIHIEVPLELDGGISIRRYAAKKGEPDFEHITDHSMPVIPGSSWAGALRHRMLIIMAELYDEIYYAQSEGSAPKPSSIGIRIKQEKAYSLIEKAFGFVKGNDARISDIIIDETEIKGGTNLTTTRVAISPFESSAKDGALYTEKTHVGGKLTLRIAIRKRDYDENSKKKEKDIIKDENARHRYEWITGMLLLAIKDLQMGLLAVGGQTAIGRGIFKEAGDIKIDGKKDIEDGYISKAYGLMNQEVI